LVILRSPNPTASLQPEVWTSFIHRNINFHKRLTHCRSVIYRIKQ